MKLLRVGPVLASIAAAFLIQPVFGDAKPADVFETIPHGQPGSCDPDTIDTIVQEAITLNIKSIEALDTLLSKNLFSFFGKEARIGWIAEAMFGIWKKPGVNMQGMGFRFNEDEKQVLRKARDAYKKSNEKLQSQNHDGGKLACGGGDWHHAKSWQDLGWDSKDVDSGNCFPPEGLYYSKHWAVKDDQGRIKPEDSIVVAAVVNGQKKAPCSGNQAAFTLLRGKVIDMCDMALKKTDLASLMATQDSWPVGKSLDDLNTPGAIFQHETFHYVDEKIVDVSIQGKTVYGWANACYLAQQSDKSPLNNAQNYVLFSLAVAFDRVKWDDEGRKS